MTGTVRAADHLQPLRTLDNDPAQALNVAPQLVALANRLVALANRYCVTE